MSSLRSVDKLKFERLFIKEPGYIMNFRNRTFKDFILESVSVDIYDSKYAYGSGSKANLLRGFWQVEDNYNVAKLNEALLEYWKDTYWEDRTIPDEKLFEECLEIVKRLKESSVEDHLLAIQSNGEEKDFTLLANSIRDTILQNKPELALDRLHTYVVKYIRGLCDKYGIIHNREKPLHSCFGEYIKYLKQNNIIESEMTERILKTSISNLEAFNKVRNDQSLAHDNPVLNYDESMLIFKNICSLVEFIQSIEKAQEKEEEKEKYDIDISGIDDLPF